VEGAAQVRAAADAAAEAMASRFAGGHKAAHAAHANGRPVVPPETPAQSREPTPRDGDAVPQITVRTLWSLHFEVRFRGPQCRRCLAL
jgi:hypothetical protein